MDDYGSIEKLQPSIPGPMMLGSNNLKSKDMTFGKMLKIDGISVNFG